MQVIVLTINNMFVYVSELVSRQGLPLSVTLTVVVQTWILHKTHRLIMVDVYDNTVELFHCIVKLWPLHKARTDARKHRHRPFIEV